MKFEKIHVDGFDWDNGNHSKVQKHGISIKDIERLFSDELLYFEDEKHSALEKRYIAIGSSAMSRIMFVSFTFRKLGTYTFIRAISARYTHRKEQEVYENIKKNFE